MATQNFTHSDRKPSESVGGLSAHTLDAERPLKVSIRPYQLDFWEYEGTRAQLEAENVIPPDTEWPDGALAKCFTVGRFRYRLSRTRPDGVKGPMKMWTCGDWWSLRCELINAPDAITLEILAKKRELDDALYRQSPAGQRALDAHWAQLRRAQEDKAFQAIRANFFPQRKKPGRKPKSEANQEAQTGAGGGNA